MAGSAAQHWGDYMRGDPDPPACRGGNEGAFPFVRRRGPLAIVGLTTSVPTGPLMATGRLGGEQLARLAEILIALAREPVFRVVLIHHPPMPNRGHYMKRLIDGPMLRAMLAEHGAELVLHGHNHEQQLSGSTDRRAASRRSACRRRRRSSAITTSPRPTISIAIDGGPGAWHCEMVTRGLRADRNGITELARQTLR